MQGLMSRWPSSDGDGQLASKRWCLRATSTPRRRARTAVEGGSAIGTRAAGSNTGNQPEPSGVGTATGQGIPARSSGPEAGVRID